MTMQITIITESKPSYHNILTWTVACFSSQESATHWLAASYNVLVLLLCGNQEARPIVMCPAR